MAASKTRPAERTMLLPTTNGRRNTAHPVWRALASVLFIILLLVAWHTLAHSRLPHRRAPAPPSSAWPESLRTHCASVPPIAASDYLARQRSLASVLHKEGAAYIAEPGASAGFFANLSGSAWHLSERPLLLVVAPSPANASEAQITVLTPAFEETRARGLPLAAEGVQFVAWAEHEDAFEVAVRAGVLEAGTKAYVDGMARQFVVAGVAAQGVKVEGAPESVRALRERKSKAEIGILKCANEATVLAIRAVRDKMRIGSRESEVRAMLADALKFAGLSDGGGLVLFGENAALPHGSGSDRVLGVEDLVLIDAGGALHGYVSDVTRTFALNDTKLSARQLDVWNLVQSAQTAALAAAVPGAPLASVDAAARAVIDGAGLGARFTHRLGHGIGLEGHEAPYLVGGARGALAPGHTFSDEPGVYVEGELGVRLEDCFVVAEEGAGVYLTEGTGGQQRDPWHP